MRISDEGVEITKRFFSVIDMLIEARIFRGIKTFTTLYGLNRRNLLHIKESPQNTVLKPETLALLVKHHNVSAMWLLAGVGPVFQDGTNELPAVEKRRRKTNTEAHSKTSCPQTS